MRLSEAIRLGSMMKPQAFGNFYGPERESSCALGAAFDACGMEVFGPDTKFDGPFGLEYFEDEYEIIACPVCGIAEWPTIGHLNDFHRWTREAIADWVETIENAQAAQVAPETVEAAK